MEKYYEKKGKPKILLNPQLFRDDDKLFFVAYGSSDKCKKNEEKPQQDFKEYEKDEATMTATVKFKPRGPNEILLHFDDIWRKPEDEKIVMKYNLDYVIENGVLVFKHTQSKFICLVDISTLEDLANAQDKPKDGGSVDIEFPLLKADMKELIRDAPSSDPSLVCLDMLTFQSQHHLECFNKEKKDDKEEHIQITVENRNLILNVEALKEGKIVMAEDF